MIIIRILVQHYSVKLTEKKFIPWPDLSDVERVKRLFLRLSRRHDLHVRSPFRLFALFDLVEHIVIRVIRVKTHVLLRIRERHEFLLAFLEKGVFDEMPFPLLVDSRKSMACIAMKILEHSSCGLVLRICQVNRKIKPTSWMDSPLNNLRTSVVSQT